jgi:hypothetical protein
VKVSCICEKCKKPFQGEEAQDVVFDFSSMEIVWRCPNEGCRNENRMKLLNKTGKLPRIGMLRK